MKISIKIIISFILLILFSSCDKTITEKQESFDYSYATSDLRSENPNQFVRNGITYLQGAIRVTCGSNQCQGDNIGPHDFCQLAMGPNSVQCTCSGCTMTVVFNEFQSNFDIWIQIHSENLHLDEFADITYEMHGESIVTLNSIDFNFQPLFTTILYSYTLANGSEETIMFVNTYTDSGLTDKTYTINCTGTCGCREQFNLNTSTASCSCDECTLTVTVSEAKINNGGN